MISEVDFALEHKSAEFSGVRIVEWVGFPEFGFGVGVVFFENFVDSLGKCGCFLVASIGTGSLIGSFIVNGFNMCRFMLRGHVCRSWWM